MKVRKFNENIDQSVNVDVKNKTLIRSSTWDDWESIYLNGELLSEGHSLRLDEVLEKLIKRNIDLSGYVYYGLEFYKDGKYIDFPEMEGPFGPEPLFDNSPKTLGEMFSTLEENGYTYKFT